MGQNISIFLLKLLGINFPIQLPCQLLIIYYFQDLDPRFVTQIFGNYLQLYRRTYDNSLRHWRMKRFFRFIRCSWRFSRVGRRRAIFISISLFVFVLCLLTQILKWYRMIKLDGTRKCHTKLVPLTTCKLQSEKKDYSNLMYLHLM